MVSDSSRHGGCAVCRERMNSRHLKRISMIRKDFQPFNEEPVQKVKEEVEESISHTPIKQQAEEKHSFELQTGQRLQHL